MDSTYPNWSTAFLVSAADLEKASLNLVVSDDDGADSQTVGSDLLTSEDVVGKKVIRKKFGAVDELLIEVQTAKEDAQPWKRAVEVKEGERLVDAGIDLVGGQTVHVIAQGEYCEKSGRCFGPEGNEASTILEAGFGLPTLHEGQLFALVGEVVYPVGNRGSFVSRSSGRLVLGIAKTEVTSGSLKADVSVYYPIK
jgi:hypothetical protein